ncbi:sigma-54 interaction domain-containing protein [Aminipila sp.]|uniref:sigma-54 interaction domain-containing protein n=1 Tax=Aminipila sp. TaxID=2060095 RepID=UPI00289D9562|nr:sigma 54-interacting transcriptional regulator [Aminipila sp.]
MKKIAVIANHISFANYIKSNLELYFDGYADIITYSIKEIENKVAIEEEVVVLSAFTIFKAVSDKINKDTILQVVNMALSKDNIRILDQAPEQCRALLVNLDNRTCMQLITQIYEAGYRGLDLVPYYGENSGFDKSIKIAITPGEVQLVPPEIENIINIGERAIDTNCIIELANKLNIKGIFNSETAKKANDNVVIKSGGVEKLLSENESINDNIKALIEYIEEGIIITDISGGIYLSNEKAKEMLRGKSEVLEGFGIGDIIPDFYNKVRSGNDTILKIEDKNLVISKKDILSAGNLTGSIIILKNFEELEDRQHGIRTQIAGSRHIARFTFDDIIGESREIKECIGIGKRIAKSDSSVLITGESGTGKEVFAQSIHNESHRKNYNFVALNCAAIPENLLESELFGYEEGAFTGARKGGKIGYFELAHRGTIFLDEIGEMPLSLQSKILRVLEEKKVSKIGSSKLIEVDVRIIAATNKNLYELVKEKKFREDLYYRFNVLPLNIPNLNNRGRDVLILFEKLAEGIGAKWTYSEELGRILLSHLWRGNVREVRNVVEYIDSLDKDIIEPWDLPDNFREEAMKIPPLRRLEETARFSHACRHIGFILREGKSIELLYGVLSVLEEEKRRKKRAGRAEVEKIILAQGLDYTETEVRNSMKKLSDNGYIKSQRGRAGSSITGTGIELLNEIKGLIG